MIKSISIIFFCLLLSAKNEFLTNGIYKIKFKDLYLDFHHKRNKFYFSSKFSFRKSASFRFSKVSNITNISFFLIESLKHNSKFYSEKKELKSSSSFDKSNFNYYWSIINKDESSVIIKNKNGCFIKISNSYKVTCIDSFQEASELNLIKLYEEVCHSEEDIKIIEKEPIDILIKYIDLRDPQLNRKGIHQINKDLDNEELRYSIRSILKNIPWVRKIYILMPNEKVRYFKELNEIKEKIVYVKDKDLIGFDSSSSLVFQFRYWKMKEFNMSDNFIAMDDDCYFGKPLKKTDFFYVDNKKVVPLIITSKFLKFNKEEVYNNIYYYKTNIKKSKKEQNFEQFQYSKHLTYSLIMQSLSKKELIVPKFTHNAIPTNINEIKEIYDLINESQFRKTTLYSYYRHIESLQFQTFVLGYTFNRYKKKIKNISHKLIRFGNSLFSNYNYDLFCVNTNSHENSELSSKIFKIVMEKLYPDKSPYEIIDYSLPSLSFHLIQEMKKRTDDLEKELFKIKKENIKLNKLKHQIQNQSKEFNTQKEKLKKRRKNFVLYIFLAFVLVLFIKKMYNYSSM